LNYVSQVKTKVKKSNEFLDQTFGKSFIPMGDELVEFELKDEKKKLKMLSMMLFKHYEIFCPWKPNCPITRAQKLFKYNCITTKSSKVYVATLALGSRPRQWLARARAKRKARECGRV
jgi:hypothetical protein